MHRRRNGEMAAADGAVAAEEGRRPPRWRRWHATAAEEGQRPLGVPSAASVAPNGGIGSSEMAAVCGEKGGGLSGENGSSSEIVGAVRVNPNPPTAPPCLFAAGRMGRPTAPPLPASLSLNQFYPHSTRYQHFRSREGDREVKEGNHRF